MKSTRRSFLGGAVAAPFFIGFSRGLFAATGGRRPVYTVDDGRIFEYGRVLTTPPASAYVRIERFDVEALKKRATEAARAAKRFVVRSKAS